MKPLERTVKMDDPLEEAILNILLVLPDIPCTKKVEVEVVALIPATVPLSKNVDVPSAVEEMNREMNPLTPPVTPPPPEPVLGP